MKKVFKGFLAVCLAAVMVGGSTIVAFADGNENNTVDDLAIYCGEIYPNEEFQSEQEFIESLSKEDMSRYKAKMTSFAKFESTQNVSENASTSAVAPYKISIPGTFTIYYQENNYYCAPASVKSVLKYLTGTVYSQSSIASGLGTTTSGTPAANIAPYLNKKQNEIFYVRLADPIKTNMENCLYFTVANEKKPALLSIAGTTPFDWYYATKGHRLVVNAIYSDKSKIQFADPLAGSVAGCPSFYLKSSSLVSTVCKDVIY